MSILAHTHGAILVNVLSATAAVVLLTACVVIQWRFMNHLRRWIKDNRDK